MASKEELQKSIIEVESVLKNEYWEGNSSERWLINRITEVVMILAKVIDKLPDDAQPEDNDE